MSKLDISDSLVEQVARELYNLRSQATEDGESWEDNESYPLFEQGSAYGSAEYLLLHQPAALKFILAGTVLLGVESRNVALFLAEVIMATFYRAGFAGGSLEPSKFIDAFVANHKIAVKVGQAHNKFAKRYFLNSGNFRQPVLVNYITSALLSGGETCPYELPREDLGTIYLVLQTIINVLDEASSVEAKQEN